jgi:hypothetical protein
LKIESPFSQFTFPRRATYGVNHFPNATSTPKVFPFDQPGKNMDKGGYLTVVGDIQIDLHNLIWGYREDRLWNMQVYPRAGAAYNFGVSKGTPLVGLGIGNTFKLNDQLGLYFDVAYNMVSSGFVGVEKDTGTGSNSNGFFDISLGVTFNISKTKTFKKVGE